MVESFNGTHVDRFSYCSRRLRMECKSVQDVRQAVAEARTPESAARDVQEAEARGVHVRGVLRRPVIDTVPNFDAFDFGASAPCWGRMIGHYEESCFSKLLLFSSRT